MIDPERPSAAAGEFLNYALAGRALTAAGYAQTGDDFWLWMEFDRWCQLLVMPQATPTPQNPVPWFELGGVLGAPGSDREANAPVPRAFGDVADVPARNLAPDDDGVLDPGSAHAAATIAVTLGERRVHGALSDAAFEPGDTAGCIFQVEFDEGWFLAFDFNPPGQRRYQAEWIALFDQVPGLVASDDDV